MKILNIINGFEMGGAEKLLSETLPIYNRSDFFQCDALALGGSRTLLAKELLNKKCCNLYFLNSKNIYNPLLVFKLYGYIKKYDVIHVHLFPSQYWAVLSNLLLFRKKKKIIFTIHSTSNGRMKNIFSIFDRLMYKDFSQLICITQEVKSIFLDYTKISERRFNVIENGVDIDKITKSRPYPRFSEVVSAVKNSDKLIMQVSSFRPAKDQETVIKAMALLPCDYKLLLVGDGLDNKNSCERLVHDLKLENKVFFLGNRSDIFQLLKSVDIVVQSSRWEGFGLAAVEGMGAGKPVLASDVKGLAGVVSGAGLLFEQGNEKELSQHILSLMSDKELYSQVAQSCMLRAQKYDIHYTVKKTLALYERILQEK